MSPYLRELFLHFLRHCRSTSHQRLNDGTHRAVRLHLSLQSPHSRRGIRERRVALFIRATCVTTFVRQCSLLECVESSNHVRGQRVSLSKGFDLIDYEIESARSAEHRTLVKTPGKTVKNSFILSIFFELINFWKLAYKLTIPFIIFFKLLLIIISVRMINDQRYSQMPF